MNLPELMKLWPLINESSHRMKIWRLKYLLSVLDFRSKLKFFENLCYQDQDEVMESLKTVDENSFWDLIHCLKARRTKKIEI